MNKKIVAAFLGLLSLGVAMLLLGLFYFEPAHLISVFASAGIILIGVSLSYVVPLMLNKNKQLNERKNEWKDERNVLIRQKAAWFSGIVLIFTLGLSGIILAVLDNIIGVILITANILVFSVLILTLSYYFNKKN